MKDLSRRVFLKVLGASGLGAAMLPPLEAMAATASDEFFVFIHASGGWDVTLWSDPRTEAKGLIDPASTENTDISGLHHWTSTPLGDGFNTFVPLRPAGGNLVFGPGIGNLVDFASRLTLINGIAMNTVSHPDGTVFSATGRHLSGGSAVASSVDTLLANEFGPSQLFPVVSVNYPSSFIGPTLDKRAVPLKIGNVGTVARTLTRSTLYEQPGERDLVSALLSQETEELAQLSNDPQPFRGFGIQLGSLREMLKPRSDGALADLFSTTRLAAQRPALADFDRTARFQRGVATNFIFALEAMERNVIRCVSFTAGGFDTHNNNYLNQARTQQELFDLLALMVKELDATPHPTRAGRKLADHTHILVTSDFCRTPQINFTQGRDHYPNNSALILSPKFKGNTVFGSTDLEQLLPKDAGTFADGVRPVAPPDVLATFIAAQGTDPRKYLRDGDVVRSLLA